MIDRLCQCRVSSSRRSRGFGDTGMTMLEMMLAILMLSVFAAVVAMVVEFSLRFLQSSELEGSNGVLIDHHEIASEMDRIVEVLAQPGISQEYLSGITESALTCSSNPVKEWVLPMPSISLPPGYSLCLRKTTIPEPPLSELLNPPTKEQPPKPGIYLLQALPETLNASTLPTRRLFCRPRPFC